jgi:hypothetical protein
VASDGGGRQAPTSNWLCLWGAADLRAASKSNGLPEMIGTKLWQGSGQGLQCVVEASRRLAWHVDILVIMP